MRVKKVKFMQDEETKEEPEPKEEVANLRNNNDCVKLISNDGQEFVVPVRVLC